MSAEDGPALLRFMKSKVSVPGNRDILVEYAHFTLYRRKDLSHITTGIAMLSLPTRSNLYKLIFELCLPWDITSTSTVDIPIEEDKVPYLTIMFENQKDYTFWKEGIEVLRNKGKVAAWEWVQDKIPLIQLRNKLVR